MLNTIKLGEKVLCLSCNKVINLNKETIKFNSEIEYIECPHCKKCFDIQYYHIYGKKPE